MEKEVGERKYNTFAILAIIFGFLLYPLGLIFAIIALVQIGKSGEKGKGLAIAAIIILPILVILTTIIVVLFWALIHSSLGGLKQPVAPGFSAILYLLR